MSRALPSNEPPSSARDAVPPAAGEPASPSPGHAASAVDPQLAATILEQAQVPVIAIDRAYRHLLFNGRYAQELSARYGLDAALGQSLLDCLPEPARERTKANLDRCLAGERVVAEVPLGADGAAKEVCVETVLTPIRDARGEVRGAVMALRDVSARRVADEALRVRERLLSEAQRLAHIGSWEWDVAAGQLRWSDEVFHVFGLDPATFKPSAEAFEATIHPDDRADFLRRRAEMLAAKNEACIEHRICRPDGTVRHVQEQTKLFPDATGKVVRVAGTVQDITERKEAEHKLSLSVQRQQTLLETMSEAAALNEMVFDAEGVMVDFRVLEVNPCFYETADYRGDQVIGALASELYGVPQAMLTEFWRKHRTRNVARHQEVTSPLSNRTFLVSVSPFVDGLFVTTFLDMTEQRRIAEEKGHLEARLQHAQKMEALGTLAGGVAHDFNNILGGVLAGLSVLELELGSAAATHRADFDQLKALVRRGSDLTKQLLGLGRRGKFDARPIDLARVVQETAAMFGRTRRDVTLDLAMAADLRAVVMDHAQLEQVILNLVLNAGQAMPSGGRLTVSAANCELAEAEAQAVDVTAGRFVKLTVQDSGVGMDEVTKARAFEPFFTTKGPGEGSGLGLASVYGIVRNHGGAVSIESEPGKGSTFTVLLPSTDEPSQARPATQPLVRPGRETILVVDDEPALLRLAGRLLSHLGYDVLTAPGGREAVDFVREHGERIALVVLDLTMPDLSGADSYDAIRELAPRVPVLLASGFAADEQVQALLNRGCAAFIQKPYSAEVLSERIRTLVRQPPQT